MTLFRPQSEGLEGYHLFQGCQPEKKKKKGTALLEFAYFKSANLHFTHYTTSSNNY